MAGGAKLTTRDLAEECRKCGAKAGEGCVNYKRKGKALCKFNGQRVKAKPICRAVVQQAELFPPETELGQSM